MYADDAPTPLVLLAAGVWYPLAGVVYPLLYPVGVPYPPLGVLYPVGVRAGDLCFSGVLGKLDHGFGVMQLVYLEDAALDDEYLCDDDDDDGV